MDTVVKHVTDLHSEPKNSGQDLKSIVLNKFQEQYPDKNADSDTASIDIVIGDLAA